jgi:hypothetical protein
MKKLLCCALLITFSVVHAQKFTTAFEKSAGKETATYFDCIEFYKQLDAAFPTISMKTGDTTDAGYPLHLILFNNDKQFDPIAWHKNNKIVVLVNNGIHPGEPDGIDASMMLMRDLASGKIKIPSNVVVAVIPIYNIGGSLNRNSYSRVNQDGPASYGFRGNSQNLDLNRDFIKNDSRDAMSFQKLFQYLNPEIFIDNHVSDGADYQHTMTLLTTQHNKLGYETGTFLHNVFEPAIYKDMAAKNWPLVPYVNFEGGDPDKGWGAYYDPPRYSSGYAALYQTIAFVPETHMLKPYAQRVQSTYDLMVTIFNLAGTHAKDIIEKRQRSLAAIQNATSLPVSWVNDTTKNELIHFLGYTAERKTSNISGLPRLFYNREKPFAKDVRFYNTFIPSNIVEKPKAYIIPQGWYEAVERLKRNGVKVERITRDTMINVEAYRIEDYKAAARPYEKHHRNTDTKLSATQTDVKFLKGDYIIYTGQTADRYIVETLEPLGDDSFFSWNFFDAILQQKEGYSDYRWEDVAEKYLADHPELKTQVEKKKVMDPAFAKSTSQQLNFIYKNSPYYEPAHMRYPVFRLNK